LIETTHLTQVEYYISLADADLFYHESWQHDICSFRAMTVTPYSEF